MLINFAFSIYVTQANGNGYQQQQPQHQEQPVKSIVNKQYNTPVGIYSEESIAETLSAQAEVLAGGVLGWVRELKRENEK